MLNRVSVYASARHPISLTWDKRLAMRIIPILLFVTQIHTILQALRCQTSTGYPNLRYGDPGKHRTLDYSGDGGFLYRLSSTILFWQSEEQCCKGPNMVMSNSPNNIPAGSFSILWPTFIRLCISHFVETLSCSLQGRSIMTETGMSIFEHSLAFAEAETVVGHSVGFGIFGLPKSTPTMNATSTEHQSTQSRLVSRSYILNRLNVPPEVLLVSLISCSNSLTSNILAVFGKQGRYRLISTTFWGICFMSSFVWGFLNVSTRNGDSGILRFPTVCIVGFIPHLLILLGISICLFIYSLALVLTAFSLSTNPLIPKPSSLKERFLIAHENLQAAVKMDSLRFSMHEDFYTALLKTGFSALTAASEAVFLHEGRRVQVKKYTWLEDERLDELEDGGWRRKMSGSHFVIAEESRVDLANPYEWESGYAKEKKTEKLEDGSKSSTTNAHVNPSGVGAAQRTSKVYESFAFHRRIFLLMIAWMAVSISKILDRIGITSRPPWLRKLVGPSAKRDSEKTARRYRDTMEFWYLTDDGGLQVPTSSDVDIEPEMRRRLQLESEGAWNDEQEQRLDQRLYSWWLSNGWWGTKDESGAYRPPSKAEEDDDDDTTSVLSVSTYADSTHDASEWEDESDADGQRTPTRASPFPEDTPLNDTPLDSATLARLLDPKDRETRNEARILAAHLISGIGGIVTRSQFDADLNRERAKVLLSSRYRPLHPPSTKTKLSSAEEADVLESMILSRRSTANNTASQPAPPGSSSWDAGASGLGSTGPQCVICHSSPRTIIAWPCRCLCICEDCRVSLAMNNFDKCVTCRREVGSFVRLWVP